jgi:hypothetical protein
MAQGEPSLDHRYRDVNGEISRKNGNTKVATLRLTYPKFAPGFDGNTTLREILDLVDEPSLSNLCEACNPRRQTVYR